MNLSEKNIIPDQKEGASSDTFTYRECHDESEASRFFSIVKKRLFDVNEWEKIAGLVSADFRLCNSEGNVVNREVERGDYFRIDVPGPGSVTGEGYDWVQVEEIKHENEGSDEFVAITVRPASNPLNNKNDVAHFFNNSATSTFIIKKEGRRVSAEVHGRNEKPNAEPEKIIDKVRNTAMAAVAVAGFSKLQWKALAEGLVKP